MSNPLPGSAVDTVFLPSEVAIATDPLAVVAYLSKRRDVLVAELAMCQQLLADAWKRVPADPNILKAPHKADIAVTCRECGQPTKWRTGTGAAQCYPACHEETRRRKTTIGIPQAVWDLLLGDSDDPAGSLDDD